MKLIFLDIDGVLNNQLWYKETKHIDKTKDTMEEHELRQFDPRCIEILNNIIEKTNAKVVISSSWRIGKSVEQLENLFEKVGFKGDIIDKTPSLQFQTFSKGYEDYNYSVPRGNEIKAWLEMNKGTLGEKISRLRYAILDDDSDMLYWQRENYFRVDAYCGLTPNLGYRIINFLNK
jgi:hypothetical protein